MRSLELSILDILTEDARTPVSQMSVMLGVSQTEIAETIARLEKQMKEAARMMEYEYAAVLRDEIIRLRAEAEKK